MDYLSRLLSYLEQNCKIRGVNFNRDINLTHLFFANDILLFVEDHDDSIENMIYVIHLFELAFGLCVNMNKSTIFPINSDSNHTDMWLQNGG